MGSDNINIQHLKSLPAIPVSVLQLDDEVPLLVDDAGEGDVEEAREQGQHSHRALAGGRKSWSSTGCPEKQGHQSDS